MPVNGRYLQLSVPLLLFFEKTGYIDSVNALRSLREVGEAMKIRVEHGEFPENEVVLRCKELDDEMLEVLALLHERSARIACFKDGETHFLLPGEVFYAEAVDGKTFLYTSNLILETHQSLSALHNRHEEAGLMRIGKSQLCNLYHVAKLKSLPNSRVEITLKNSERLIVSRHYVQSLKERLGILE